MTVHSSTAGSGSAAPEFELPDWRGGSQSLADLRVAGPVILTFLRGFA
ncbi:MAG: hypothetical protein HYU28_11570 [Actinobacteria bacterium]|nr:hypothetical protein [Actinomycetota bacterium]